MNVVVYDAYFRSDVCLIEDSAFHKNAHHYDNITALLNIPNWLFSKEKGNNDQIAIEEGRYLYNMDVPFKIACAQIDITETTRVLIRRWCLFSSKCNMIVQMQSKSLLPNCGDTNVVSLGNTHFSEFLNNVNGSYFLDELAIKKYKNIF